MGKFRAFILGAVVGSLCVGGAVYAANGIRIDVSIPNLTYWLDGQKIESSLVSDGKFASGSESVPLTMLYKGTAYVPLRFITNSLGKEVKWDKENNRMLIETVANVPFVTVRPDGAPEEVKQWVERSKDKCLGQSMVVGGDTYLLVTRGEESSGGYSIKIVAVRQYADRYVVVVKLADPPKGSVATQPMTYPTALAKVNGVLAKDIVFMDSSGNPFPQLVGLPNIPLIFAQSANIVLFAPVQAADHVEFRGMARAFEGMLNYRIITDDGAVLAEKAVQASAGAPDWGYFSVSVPTASVQQGSGMQFYLLSPKDGSMTEVVNYSFQQISGNRVGFRPALDVRDPAA
ncbi:MAG TPA: Gmad2 immunoglobulin-like domain-containing protein [Bacilli bacterium]